MPCELLAARLLAFPATMILELLARLDDRLRPGLVRFSPALALRLYSRGRPRFLEALAKSRPTPLAFPLPHSVARPPGAEQVLWGLRFRSPLGNAAGMFKNGEGYELVASQGAGFYLAGSSTALPRKGNRKGALSQPFAPYPRSHAASNWLGLPNDGDRAVARRLAALERVAGCPVGASICAAPELAGEARQTALVEGLQAYDEAGVDFLEINESCPNTSEGPLQHSGLAQRLEVLAKEFLSQRRRSLPVVVKFSCDSSRDQVPSLVDLLLDLGFDGVNFGNTSTDYDRWRGSIAAPDLRLYDTFTSRFGGGLSGRPLKAASLELACRAVEHAAGRRPGREFHVIRTGGVEGAEDLVESLRSGIALVGWYTGYFDAFGRRGHDVYRRVYEDLLALEVP